MKPSHKNIRVAGLLRSSQIVNNGRKFIHNTSSTPSEVSAASSKRKPALQNDPDLAMPTPLSMGFNITYHPAKEGLPTYGAPRRPLAILAGWMGAKERQLKPYIQFYHQRGVDTLSFAVGPKHILLPEHAMDQMKEVLTTARNPWSAAMPQNDALYPVTTLIFHHFSVGGFLYGQMLRLLAEDPTLEPLKNAIKAQIFDSPPDIRSIARGISRGIGVNPPVSTAVEYIMKGYLAATRNTSVGAAHRASSAAFHGNMLTMTPALWYYSKADPVSPWEDCAGVASKWRNAGMSVTECVWDHTPHIQHGRLDPDRYFGTLEAYLQNHQVLTEKKK